MLMIEESGMPKKCVTLEKIQQVWVKKLLKLFIVKNINYY